MEQMIGNALAFERVSYEIDFVGGFESVHQHGGAIDADVRSAHLDHDLHPSGSMRARFSARSAGPSQGFTLGAFQLCSLVDYLRSQRTIKAMVSDHLVKHIEPTMERNPADVWASYRMLHVEFGPKMVWTSEQLSNLQKSFPVSVEKVIAASDREDTVSHYEMVIEDRRDREHRITISVRDGVVVSYGLA